jgi:hypothetical protein
MQIDASDEHPENARDSIRRTLDDESKRTSRRDLQDEKQSEQSVSTKAGM